MELPKDGSLLRIFIGESDRHAGMLLTNGLSGPRESTVWRERQCSAGLKVLAHGAESARQKSWTCRRICRSSSKSSIPRKRSKPCCRRLMARLATDSRRWRAYRSDFTGADRTRPLVELTRVWLFRTPYDIELAKEKSGWRKGPKDCLSG